MPKLNNKGLILKITEVSLIIAAVVSATIFVILFLDNSRALLPFSAIVCLLLIAAYLRPSQAKATAEYCFRHRWAIALLVFLLCVILRLHGSSIGIYDEVFPTQIVQGDSTLFGVPRWIRSDEYGVQTMKFFSQYYNRYGFFSHRMSISASNMVLDYYSPVLDITALGKPLMWGYLIFGNEVGLSWYWCGTIILLFMTALELLLVVTRENHGLSVLGAVMILLSPAIQWWVMPHMPIVILYSMSLFCTGYYFFTSGEVWRKWLFAALGVISIVGFWLSIFPSFQIPCLYTVLVLLIVCLRRDRDQFTFCRKEWYRFAIPSALAVGILVYFCIKSRADLSLLMNTDYPGSRINTTSGCSVSDLFANISSLFLPYKDITYLNNCEASSYIHFAPFFLVLMPRITIYLRKKNSPDLAVGIAFAVLLLLLAFYMCIGISETLARITLLKYCNRMKAIYGWVATLFTVWGIHILVSYPDILKKWQKLIYPPVFGLVSLLLIDKDTMGYFNSFPQIKGISSGSILLIGAILILTVILVLVCFGRKRIFTAWLLVIMFVAGGVVNPVERGIGAVTNHSISQSITQISQKDPDAAWLCTDTGFFLSNYVLANGARVLNATNFYPDTEKWKIIDPEGQYRTMSNRYSNQNCSLVETGNNKVELLNPDNIRYSLNPATLKKLNIRYLFSTVDYTAMLNKHDISCELLITQDGYTIYRLEY